MSAAPKVIIVASLGRCGTSLTMQMLQAGGIPCVGEHPAFEDPRTNIMDLNYRWLGEQRGRAVKLLDPHRGAHSLRTIYATVIWLDRDPTEQAKSQIKFSRALFPELQTWRTPVKGLRASLVKERSAALASTGYGVHSWLTLQLEELVTSPMTAAQTMAKHLAADGFAFDWKKAWRVVRGRSPLCFDGLLEVELMKLSRARA